MPTRLCFGRMFRFVFFLKRPWQRQSSAFLNTVVIRLLWRCNYPGSVLSTAEVVQSHNTHLTPTCGRDGAVFPSPWTLHRSATKNSRLAELASHLWRFLSGSQNTSWAGIQSPFQMLKVKGYQGWQEPCPSFVTTLLRAIRCPSCYVRQPGPLGCTSEPIRAPTPQGTRRRCPRTESLVQCWFSVLVLRKLLSRDLLRVPPAV